MNKDDFNIDQFIEQSFKKIEKTLSKKNTKPSSQKIKVDLPTTHFGTVIDSHIYDEMNMNTLDQKNQFQIEDILKPLFPNDTVYQNEFTQDKVFLLDKFIGNPSKVSVTNSKGKASVRNNLKFQEHGIIKQLKSSKDMTYENLLPMNHLWNDYISKLMNKTLAIETISNKIIKADLHGSIIEVVDSKNTTLVNMKGIVLLETKRTFNIMTEENKIKTILKKGSMFKIDLPYGNISIKIFGENFMYKAVERTKAKFKTKYNL